MKIADIKETAPKSEYHLLCFGIASLNVTECPGLETDVVTEDVCGFEGVGIHLVQEMRQWECSLFARLIVHLFIFYSSLGMQLRLH